MTGDAHRPLEEFNKPEVVARLISGHADEFEKLCLKATPILLSIILHNFKSDNLNVADAEEIVSDTLFATSKAITRFVPTTAKLSTWLIRIAINHAKNHLKKQSRKKRSPPKQADVVFIEFEREEQRATNDTEAESNKEVEIKRKKASGEKIAEIRQLFAHLNAQERAEKQRQTLGRLKKKSRDILWQSSMRSDKDIAESLDISTRNVQVRRTRALDELLAVAKKITSS